MGRARVCGPVHVGTCCHFCPAPACRRAQALGRQAAADAALAEAAQTLQVAGPAAVAGGSPALVAKARALRDFLAGGA